MSLKSMSVLCSLNWGSLYKYQENTQFQDLELLHPPQVSPLYTFCFQHEIFFKTFTSLLVCVYMNLYVQESMEAVGSLEQDLGVVASHHACSREQTWIFCKT